MTTILTLRLDDQSQSRFDMLRERHFPPERNQISAHLTLFHDLPDPELVSGELIYVSSQMVCFPLRVSGLRSLGKGVAYTLTSPLLLAIHARLATSFDEHLIPQDRQRFQPHVVVQNKVSPEAARTLLAGLQASFKPYEVQAVGLDLWQYLGGPWRHLRTFPFDERAI